MGSERRRRAAVPSTVVDPDDQQDVTSPIAVLLECEDEPDDRPVIERLRRESRDPYELIWNTAKALTKQKERERSGSRALTEQVLSVIADQSADAARVRAQVADLQRSARVIRVVAGFVVTAVLGCAGFVVTRLWSTAERGGETSIRLQHLEHAIQLFREDLREVMRRPSNLPTWAHDKDKP